jgi:hypothetical protein
VFGKIRIPALYRLTEKRSRMIIAVQSEWSTGKRGGLPGTLIITPISARIWTFHFTGPRTGKKIDELQPEPFTGLAITFDLYDNKEKSRLPWMIFACTSIS